MLAFLPGEGKEDRNVFSNIRVIQSSLQKFLNYLIVHLYFDPHWYNEIYIVIYIYIYISINIY